MIYFYKAIMYWANQTNTDNAVRSNSSTASICIDFLQISTYVYICIWVFICIYICIYICTCMYVYTYIYTYIHIYIHIHIYKHVYIYVHTCICIYIYICKYVCTHVLFTYIWFSNTIIWFVVPLMTKVSDDFVFINKENSFADENDCFYYFKK